MIAGDERVPGVAHNQEEKWPREITVGEAIDLVCERGGARTLLLPLGRVRLLDTQRLDDFEDAEHQGEEGGHLGGGRVED